MNIARSRPTRAFRSVVQALPPISAPTSIPDYDGLLPITELGKDLIINMPWWAGVEPQMELQAAWKLFDPSNPNDPGDTEMVGTFTEVSAAQAGDPTTVFAIVVPQALLTHGVYLVRVRARSVPGGGKDWSVAIRIEVDTVAPGGGALPYLKFNQPVETSLMVTDDDIVNGFLPAFLAHYEGIKPGDEIVPIIADTPFPVDTITIPDPLPITDFIPVYFSQADLLAVNGGLRTLNYSVTDKAGNSATSREQLLTIDLASKPESLLAPLVPRANDGIVNEEDARAVVQVHIPKFDKAQVDDEIVVHWGDQVADGVKLTAADIGNDPFIGVQLPYQYLVDAGDGTLQVFYEVFRGNNLVATSPDKSVLVDLEVSGGRDPDPTTPWNDNLLPPKVISDSGAGEENTIPPEDYGKAATAVIAWLGKDGTEVYEVDDKILLTWGNQTGSQVLRTVLAADVTAKVDLVLTVPTATIEAQGSGDILVFYNASRVTSLPPVENTSLSPSQDVPVTSADELPGGGTLAAPTFPVLNDLNTIGPDELLTDAGLMYNPVRVATDYTNGGVGDTVELFLVGYDELDGGNQIPAAAYNPQPPYELKQADIDRGYYDFRVPAQYHYAVCSRGAVEANVIIKNAAGSTTSPKTRVWCDVKQPEWDDCNNRP